MEEEIKALIKNGMWTLAKPPKDRHIIGSNGSYTSSEMVMTIQFTFKLVLLLEVFLEFQVLIFKIHLVLT